MGSCFDRSVLLIAADLGLAGASGAAARGYLVMMVSVHVDHGHGTRLVVGGVGAFAVVRVERSTLNTGFGLAGGFGLVGEFDCAAGFACDGGLLAEFALIGVGDAADRWCAFLPSRRNRVPRVCRGLLEPEFRSCQSSRSGRVLIAARPHAIGQTPRLASEVERGRCSPEQGAELWDCQIPSSTSTWFPWLEC
ncbi:MAG: hypothetical protein FWD57_14250 [Polyangiaceae bacterium]|nr:hypothetical protein [Polyangiaceae bacterium]